MSYYTISSHSIPEKYIFHEGKEKIWLGGTNYLSIGSHPLFQEKLGEGIKKFPQNWGSSRKNNVQLEVFEQIENQLADKFPEKGIALCSSGMAAAQTALYFIQKNHPQIAINLAPFTHPALWTASSIRNTGKYNDWVNKLDDAEKQCICSDGIGAPYVQEFDLSWTNKTGEDTFIVIDESHRIGLLDINLKTKSQLIQTASLSKAYGIPAGIIIGSKNWINELKNDPFWVGSSPPNPAFIYACLHAEEAYEDRKSQLNTRLNWMEKIYPIEENQGIQRVKSYPGFSSYSKNLFDSLNAKGFLVNQFAYPNITDPAICKGIIHPLLSNEELEKIAECFIQLNVNVC
jgi:8-amino-7-oxononanoate synthase